MKRFGLLFAIATLGLTFAASAADSDPGYGPDRPGYGERRMWSGPRVWDLPTVGAAGVTPLYYRPTMRYYGNGYTVSYRYIPVFPQDSIYNGGTAGSSNFRSEGFRLSDEEVLSWGANSPRLTVKDARSAAPRTAVTTIIRKKSSKGASKAALDVAPTDAPAITPTPATDSTPVVQPKP